MKVKVMLEREAGVFRPSHNRKNTGTGDLHLTYRTARDRRVAVLQLLGAEQQWPSLYEPRLVDLSASRMCFIGSERVGEAWVVQEWICEVL